jgi:hypothetical protein
MYFEMILWKQRLKSKEVRLTMFKRKNREMREISENREKAYIYYCRDYYFISKERIFKYFEITLMNQR